MLRLVRPPIARVNVEFTTFLTTPSFKVFQMRGAALSSLTSKMYLPTKSIGRTQVGHLIENHQSE
jgi:hypothetical protein